MLYLKIIEISHHLESQTKKHQDVEVVPEVRPGDEFVLLVLRAAPFVLRIVNSVEQDYPVTCTPIGSAALGVQGPADAIYIPERNDSALIIIIYCGD